MGGTGPDIVCLGEPLVEFVRAEHPEIGPYYRPGFGGDTSNAAIAAARQGARVGYLTALGRDVFGEQVLALWAGEGIDTGAVRRKDAPTGIYFVDPDPSGRRFTYYRAGSAASLYWPGDLPAGYVESARALHLSAITQAISAHMLAASVAAMRAARRAGTLVSYDTNLRLALWPIERARETIVAALGQADIALPSEDEARLLWGIDDTDAMIDHLLALGPGIVALKCGDRGAVIATPDRRETIAPAPSRPVELDRRGRRFRRQLPGRVPGDRRPVRRRPLRRARRRGDGLGLRRRRADPAPSRAGRRRAAGLTRARAAGAKSPNGSGAIAPELRRCPLRAGNPPSPEGRFTCKSHRRRDDSRLRDLRMEPCSGSYRRMRGREFNAALPNPRRAAPRSRRGAARGPRLWTPRPAGCMVEREGEPMRPNILILMVDQLNGTLWPDGPAGWLHAPNLARLAERSTRFANSYTASPLCAPGRASFMSGQLPRRTGVYDNAAEFVSSIPTYAHHLRRAGYRTVMSGKMHFVGPDQLHGLEERLTTDIYPADFGWTPDYRKPGERIDWWYHNLGSVTGAGVAEITNQLEYDDEVAFHAVRQIHDFAREAGRPWCLTASFTHPHDPYVARRKHWDRYEDCRHLAPEIPAIPYDRQDPHSRRLLDACDWRAFDITDRDIARARRGYFGAISYVDEKIGEILSALEATRQEAIIVFLSDHGDMLGERGLWFKMSFYEGSSRVPLTIAAPDLAPGLIETPVSTVDVLPTLAELAGVPLGEVMPWTDGESLVPLATGTPRTTPVAMEYAAEGSVSPLVALRDGRWKHVRCEADPDQLFDVKADPHELTDLSRDPAYQSILREIQQKSRALWDLPAYDSEVRESQARRHVVYEALRNGAYYPWDFQPLQRASERYMRNHMDLNVLEEQKRFPRGE